MYQTFLKEVSMVFRGVHRGEGVWGLRPPGLGKSLVSIEGFRPHQILTSGITKVKPDDGS